MATRRPPANEPGTIEDSENWGAQPASHRTALAAAASALAATEQDDEEEEPPVERIMRLIGEKADPEKRTRIQLWRVHPENGLQFCDDYQPAQFEQGGFKAIRAKWGPGTYEIRLYGVRPGGTKFVVLAKPQVTLEADPTDTGYDEGPAADAINPQLAQVLQGIQATQQAIVEALAARPNPAAQLQETLSLMATMREVMGMGGAPTNGVKELVEGVRALKEAQSLLGGGEGADKEESETSRLLTLAGSVVSIVKEAGVGGGGVHGPSTPMLPLHVPASIDAAPVAPIARPQPRAPSPARAPAPSPHLVNPAQLATATPVNPIAEPSVSTSPPAPAAPAMSEEERMFMEKFTETMQRAAANADVRESAEWMYEWLPDDLLGLMATPAWWRVLVEAYPDVAVHQAWLTAVRNDLLELHASQGDDDEETAAE